MKSVTFPNRSVDGLVVDEGEAVSKGECLRDVLEQMKLTLIQRATAMTSA